MRDRFIVFVFVLVLSLPALSLAAPLELLGHCYAGDHQTIEEWEKRLPVVDATGKYIQYTIGAWTPSVVGGSLTVPYTVKIGNGTASNQTATFPPCDVGQSGSAERQFSLETLVIVAVGIMLAMSAFNFAKWRH